MPLIIAFFGAAIAAFWPWIQSLQRGRRFQRIIRRELEEIGPRPEAPVEDKPWWDHATRRFIHEELFHRQSISQNRDFLLSLDPTLIYQVSQLWIALEKRDGRQWLHFLSALARNRRVGSPGLRDAHKKWETIIGAQRAEWLTTMGTPTAFRQGAVLARVPPLFDRRFVAYGRLLALTDVGSAAQPRELDLPERSELADGLMAWYYEQGAGLLLSGRAFAQFQRVQDALLAQYTEPAALQLEFSRLRTDLKIDLGVRQVQERDVAIGWPEEERW
ncbi:hypothetical protein [Kribbella orskensis]|uniref:hypothetical protein n=1 Tax=Kribbella orskensis TaxID=2512216 RepID=UPI0010441DB7|nr:hypothetical protein [Kribbella orskensis]